MAITILFPTGRGGDGPEASSFAPAPPRQASPTRPLPTATRPPPTPTRSRADVEAGDPPPGTGAFLAPRNGAKGIDEQTVSNGTASDAIVKLPRAGEATAVGYVHVADETTGKGIAPGTHDIQFCLGIGDDPGTRPSVRVDRDPGVWQG